MIPLKTYFSIRERSSQKASIASVITLRQFITKEFAQAIPKLTAAGIPVYFVGEAPVGICDTGIYAAMDDRELIDRAVQAAPANAGGTAPADEILRRKITAGQDVVFTDPWKRSTCAAAAYPSFEGEKEVALPDSLETEEPLFSGYVRYENRFVAEEGDDLTLEITDAYEGVEVFINGVSLGLQVSPAFRYDLTGHFTSGTNKLRIEVATTLERERSVDPDVYGQRPAPTSRSGITGTVRLVKSPSAR